MLLWGICICHLRIYGKYLWPVMLISEMQVRENMLSLEAFTSHLKWLFTKLYKVIVYKIRIKEKTNLLSNVLLNYTCFILSLRKINEFINKEFFTNESFSKFLWYWKNIRSILIILVRYRHYKPFFNVITRHWKALIQQLFPSGQNDLPMIEWSVCCSVSLQK